MVEIFKTNIDTLADAENITDILSRHLSSCTVRFDLEDCDRILKIEAMQINTETVIELISGVGFSCEVLE